MDKLGTVVKTVARRVQDQAASPSSQSSLPAVLPKLDESGRPIRFDRETDREIPLRVVCDRDVSDVVRKLRRSLSTIERSALQSRADALKVFLRPFTEEEYDQVRADVAAMLSGFRYMRHDSEAASATLDVTLAVLRQFPGWAISAACNQIICSRQERRFAPNDTEIFDAVSALVRMYSDAQQQAVAVLAAPVEEAAPRPTKAELEAKLGRPIGERRTDAREVTKSDITSVNFSGIDPESVNRLLAELEQRKARNNEREEQSGEAA